MATQLDALRRSVARDAAFAVLAFGLASPKNLDLSDADVAAKVMFERWEQQPSVLVGLPKRAVSATRG